MRDMNKHESEPDSGDFPTTSDVYDLIDELTASRKRLQLIAALRGGAKTRSELADRCDSSKSTVNRNAQELQKYGWAEQNIDREYQLTPLGERVAQHLADFATGVKHFQAEPEMIEHYRGDTTIPPEVLAEATVDTANPDNAQAALQEYMGTIKSEKPEATDVRLLGGTTGPVMIDLIQELIESAAHLEIVVDEATTEASPSGFAAQAQRGELPDNFDLYTHPERIQFGLLIIGDELAMIGAYDERGDVQAGMQGESKAVIDWAEEVYETYRERARPVGQ
jgi:predicted transcriptional regulator